MSYDVMQELNKLVGLTGIKQRLEKMYKAAQFDKTPLKPSHFIFVGNPGTGKTVVARLIGKIYHSLGVLPTSKVVEVSKADLTSVIIGNTSKKTLEKCREALGGVLLIDEAYMMGAGDDECLVTILRFMEEYRDSVCVIFVGYKEPMEKFIQCTTGLIARIGKKNVIEFPDYSIDELMQIAVIMAKDKGLTLDESCLPKLQNTLNNCINNANGSFGNAREVRMIIDEAHENLNARLFDVQESGGSVSDADRTVLLDKDLKG